MQAGDGQLLFVDESDLHLLPVERAMWMNGRRRRIPTPGTNRRHAFFGALDARRGNWVSTDHAHKRAAHFLAFLQRLMALYPSGPLYVALDHAPIHTARLTLHWLADQPRVIALWLPKYAGHGHNPVERIWGLMLGYRFCLGGAEAFVSQFLLAVIARSVPLAKAVERVCPN